MGFTQYLVTRLLLTVPMILILLTLVFVVLRVMPGDACTAVYGGRGVAQSVLENCRRQLDLNKPLPAQYWDYIVQIAHFDFGKSTRSRVAVREEIFRKLPATLELALAAMLIATLVGLLTGIPSATHADHPLDHGLRTFNVMAFAMPIFWLGLMLQIVFAVMFNHWFGWGLPVGGRLSITRNLTSITGLHVLDSLIQLDLDKLADALRHLILPAFTLGVVLSGVIGRISRANMLEVLDKDYIRTGRAKGLHERDVIYRHALRNALIPIVTVIGLQFALLLGGAILTETVYSWDGLASYLLRAIYARDYPAIQGTVVFFAIFVSTVNLIVDLIYARLDPRVRY